jgi:predicted DNA-binding transcriptional regulator AlpA
VQEREVGVSETITETKLLVPAKEAAQMLAMSKSSLWAKAKKKEVPQPVHIGGLTRWRVSDLRAHIASPKAVREVLPPSVELAPGTVQLYRHFDKDGVLLYVGISLSAIARLAEHRNTSHWFWSIAKTEVAAYATRASALKAERITILREKPLHNVIHKVRT